MTSVWIPLKETGIFGSRGNAHKNWDNDTQKSWKYT